MNDTKLNETSGSLTRIIGLSSPLYLLLTISGLTQSGEGMYWIALGVAFGVIILSAWIYEWRIVLYFTPAILLYLVPNLAGTTVVCNLTLTTILCVITAPFALQTMKWAGIRLDPTQKGSARIWKTLLLAGLKSSLFSYLILNSLPIFGVYMKEVYQYDLAFIVGSQALGLFLLLLTLTVLMRFSEDFSPF